MIPVKAIALLRISDERGKDAKVLCVPQDDPQWNHMDELADLPGQLRDEIAHFFSIYKQPEGLEVTVDGWDSRDDALAAIDESRDRFEPADP